MMQESWMRNSASDHTSSEIQVSKRNSFDLDPFCSQPQLSNKDSTGEKGHLSQETLRHHH